MQSVLSAPGREIAGDPPAVSRTVRAVRRGAAATLRDRAIAFLERIASEQRSAIDERLLAGSRLGATIVLVVATVADPSAREYKGLILLLVLYLGHSAGVFAHSLSRPEKFAGLANLLQWIDLGWTIAATSVSGGTSSHVFLYFCFVVAAAAVRWGLARSLFHGSIVLVVAVLQAVAAAEGYGDLAFDWAVFLVRVPFVVIGFGLLFGVLTERLHDLRFQAAALADLISEIGRVSRLKPAIELMLRWVLEVFDAAQCCLVVEELETRTVTVWRAEWSGPRIEVSSVEVPGESRHRWLEPVNTEMTACELKRNGSGWRAASLPDAPFSRLVPGRCSLPFAVRQWSRCGIALTTPVEFARLWRGKLYVCDPAGRPRGELRLRFLRRMSLQVGPALLNLYLLRRLWSQAESHERARIARELHDGVLQSLAGMEMQLEVLRRSTEEGAPDLAGRLAEIRDLLHEQALKVRELMLGLRAVDVDAPRLRAAIKDVAARFSRSAGIATSVECTAEPMDLSPRECSEAVRIIEEALVNVRRHSGAHEVSIAARENCAGWTLVISDDGRGFGFTGTMSHEELKQRNEGPRVIRERVAGLGGTLTVESSRAGARLVMTFPRAQAA